MFRIILTSVSAFFQSVATFLRLREKAEHEEAGATKQREADQKATINAKNDQLEKAVNHRAGDARKRLRKGEF